MKDGEASLLQRAASAGPLQGEKHPSRDRDQIHTCKQIGNRCRKAQVRDDTYVCCIMLCMIHHKTIFVTFSSQSQQHISCRIEGDRHYAHLKEALLCEHRQSHHNGGGNLFVLVVFFPRERHITRGASARGSTR